MVMVYSLNFKLIQPQKVRKLKKKGKTGYFKPLRTFFAQPHTFSLWIHKWQNTLPGGFVLYRSNFPQRRCRSSELACELEFRHHERLTFPLREDKINKVGGAVVFEQSQPLLSTSCFLAAVLTVWTAATVAAQLSLRETRRWAASCEYMYTMGQDGALDWLQSSALLTARPRPD